MSPEQASNSGAHKVQQTIAPSPYRSNRASGIGTFSPTQNWNGPVSKTVGWPQKCRRSAEQPIRKEKLVAQSILCDKQFASRRAMQLVEYTFQAAHLDAER
jgi:hypothetical protein